MRRRSPAFVRGRDKVSTPPYKCRTLAVDCGRLHAAHQQAPLREYGGDLGDVAQRRAPLGHVARQVLERRPLVLRVALLGVQLDQLAGLLSEMNANSNAACSALVRFLAARARCSRAPGRPSEARTDDPPQEESPRLGASLAPRASPAPAPRRPWLRRIGRVRLAWRSLTSTPRIEESLRLERVDSSSGASSHAEEVPRDDACLPEDLAVESGARRAAPRSSSTRRAGRRFARHLPPSCRRRVHDYGPVLGWTAPVS